MPAWHLIVVLCAVLPLTLATIATGAANPARAASPAAAPKPSHTGPARAAPATHGTARKAMPSLPIPPVPPLAAPPPATAKAKKPPEQDPNKGSVTGLPLPRYASLRADVVNMRSGPGTRYPIDWVYKRTGMPVEILREFDVWRLVEAPDGQKGWMHEATLVGRRDLIIVGERQTLRAQANQDARAVAVLEPGVIGRIRSCDAAGAWCRVQVGSYRGWLPRQAFWGTLPKEPVKP